MDEDLSTPGEVLFDYQDTVSAGNGLIRSESTISLRAYKRTYTYNGVGPGTRVNFYAEAVAGAESAAGTTAHAEGKAFCHNSITGKPSYTSPPNGGLWTTQGANASGNADFFATITVAGAGEEIDTLAVRVPGFGSAMGQLAVTLRFGPSGPIPP